MKTNKVPISLSSLIATLKFFPRKKRRTSTPAPMSKTRTAASLRCSSRFLRASGLKVAAGRRTSFHSCTIDFIGLTTVGMDFSGMNMHKRG